MHQRHNVQSSVVPNYNNVMKVRGENVPYRTAKVVGSFEWAEKGKES
jgi:hypothetical protein